MKFSLLPIACCLLALPLSAEDPGHPVPAADAALPDGSLYVLDSTWTDQRGEEIEWTASRGTPRVVALGYATCKGVCPRIIADMQRIERELDENSTARFTFVSLDPENDGQAELQALVENHKLTPERWDLLRGTEDDVLELAVALGVRYDRLPNGIDFAHSYLIAVIGPDGRVLHKWTEPKQGPQAAVQLLNQLAEKSGTEATTD